MDRRRIGCSGLVQQQPRLCVVGLAVVGVEQAEVRTTSSKRARFFIVTTLGSLLHFRPPSLITSINGRLKLTHLPGGRYAAFDSYGTPRRIDVAIFDTWKAF